MIELLGIFAIYTLSILLIFFSLLNFQPSLRLLILFIQTDVYINYITLLSHELKISLYCDECVNITYSPLGRPRSLMMNHQLPRSVDFLSSCCRLSVIISYDIYNHRYPGAMTNSPKPWTRLLKICITRSAHSSFK